MVVTSDVKKIKSGDLGCHNGMVQGKSTRPRFLRHRNGLNDWNDWNWTLETEHSTFKRAIALDGLNGAPVLSEAKRRRRKAVERLELLERPDWVFGSLAKVLESASLVKEIKDDLRKSLKS